MRVFLLFLIFVVSRKKKTSLYLLLLAMSLATGNSQQLKERDTLYKLIVR